MKARWVAVLVLSSSLLGATEAVPCPADRPVDEIIVEIHKSQSKKYSRNANPLPDYICIWSWCGKTKRTPPTIPEPAPRAEAPSSPNAQGDGTGVSSSRNEAERCNTATELALQAAHNVEVGDYSFEQKNYKGAWMRYQDAVTQKPGDAAIHVRLGRVYEKLNQTAQAVDEYKAAEKLAGPEKWTEEARKALERIQKQPQS